MIPDTPGKPEGAGNRSILANTEELLEYIKRLSDRVRHLEESLRSLKDPLPQQTRFPDIHFQREPNSARPPMDFPNAKNVTLREVSMTEIHGDSNTYNAQGDIIIDASSSEGGKYQLATPA